MLAILLTCGFAALVVTFLTTENRAMRYLIIAFGCVLIGGLLAGCKSAPVIDTLPPAEITVTRYVPIPDYLTKPCPIPAGNLVEVIEVARARKASLEKCNADKLSIRGIQGTVVP